MERAENGSVDLLLLSERCTCSLDFEESGHLIMRDHGDSHMNPSYEIPQELQNYADRVAGELTNAAHIDDVFWQVQAIIGVNQTVNCHPPRNDVRLKARIQ